MTIIRNRPGRGILVLLLAAFALCQIGAAPAQAATKSPLLKQLGQEISEIATKATPSVVQVITRSTPDQTPYNEQMRQLEQFFGPGFRQFFTPRNPQIPVTGLGSGFFIDEDGTIMTNSHVIEGMDEIRVLLPDGSEFEAEVLGSDPETEVAIIRVQDADRDFEYLELGDSNDLRVGHFVVAIGSPQGLDKTVTFGIVSALNRDTVRITEFADFIQTDAAINRGNSGGPLLNTDGEVVGISTAIVSTSGGSQGLGLAIPVNQAKEIAEKIQRYGEVRRGFMGVILSELTPDLGEHLGTGGARGAVVQSVIPNSPAVGELEEYDAIVEVDGDSVENMNDLRNRIAAKDPGDRARLTVVREGQRRRVTIELGERPGREELASGRYQGETKEDEDTQADEELKLGLTVRPITQALAERLGLPYSQGFIITGIEPSSEAYRKGLRERMILLEVNRRPVANIDELREALDEGKRLKTLLLKVYDGENERILLLHRN